MLWYWAVVAEEIMYRQDEAAPTEEPKDKS